MNDEDAVPHCADMRAGEPGKTADLAERFEKIVRDRKPDEKIGPDPASKFHEIWEKTQLAGVLVQKALALNSLGEFGKSLEIVARLETEFKDETTYTKTKFGRPFPPMVLPAWGDDTGDWSDLLHRAMRGKKFDRTVKNRIVEADDLRIKFKNPFVMAAKLAKAMALWNRNYPGDQTLARQLFKELTNRSSSRDFLSTTVVGADPFLIAISPEINNQYSNIAEKLLNCEIPMNMTVYLDDVVVVNSSIARFYDQGSLHKLRVQCKDIDGNELKPNDFFKILIWKNNLNPSNSTEEFIDTKITGENIYHIKLFSHDGLISIIRLLPITIFKIGNIELNTDTIDPELSINDSYGSSNINYNIEPENMKFKINIKIYKRTSSNLPTKDDLFDEINITKSIFTWNGKHSVTLIDAKSEDGPYTFKSFILLDDGTSIEVNSYKINIVTKLNIGSLYFNDPSFGHWYKIYIPTNRGCNLSLYIDGNEIINGDSKLYIHNMSNYVSNTPAVIEETFHGPFYLYINNDKISTILVSIFQHGISRRIPWSFWYYPLTVDSHYNIFDPDGPLEKYDIHYKLSGDDSSRLWESENDFKPSGISDVYGHCWGGTVASIVVENIVPKDVGEFNKFDIKGLYTEMADGSLLNILPGQDILINIPEIKPIHGKDDSDMYISRYHYFLEECLKNLRVSMLTNVRDFYGNNNGYVENVAIYEYRTEFKQMYSDPKKIYMNTKITLTSNQMKPLVENQDNNDNIHIYMNYVLQYNDNGSVNADHENNDWINIIRKDDIDEYTLFTPENLIKFNKDNPVQWGKWHGGIRPLNPKLKIDLINKLVRDKQ